MPAPLLHCRPELLYPVDFPYKPRREDLVCELSARYLQGYNIANLVALGLLSVVVLSPLAKGPVWDIRLRRDICGVACGAAIRFPTFSDGLCDMLLNDHKAYVPMTSTG